MSLPNKASVLIADGDSLMRGFLKDILNSENFPIAGEVTNGLDAIMKCVELKPDIVLLNLHMPKMNGIRSLEEIRKSNLRVMVLMVSGNATIEEVKEALAKGAAGFLVMPLTPASVLDKINACWNQKNIKS